MIDDTFKKKEKSNGSLLHKNILVIFNSIEKLNTQVSLLSQITVLFLKEIE